MRTDGQSAERSTQNPVAGDIQQRAPSLAARVTLCLCAAAMGGAAVLFGNLAARSAVVDLGPTDQARVAGFRDIERDGPVFFRWSSVPSSQVLLPLRVCGSGTVRLRVRRHFKDPAILTVSLGGVVLGRKDVRAGVDRPYEVIEFSFSKTTCVSEPHVLLESSVDNDRSLGVAVDWIEIRSADGFSASTVTEGRGALLAALVAVVAIEAAGIGIPSAAAIVIGTSGLLAFCFSADPAGMERVLSGTVAALLMATLVAIPMWRFGQLGRLSSRARKMLLASLGLALISRAAFLHPEIFYPDYRVHGLVQETLHRGGLPAFLDHLFEIQYARSLGLQQIDGRWYPFPYPPGAYVVSEIAAKAFGLDSLLADQATALAAGVSLALVVCVAGRALGLSDFNSVLGSAFLALHPLLIRRLALGYFPGVIGQFFDACAMLLVIKLLGPNPNRILPTFFALTGSLLLAFLVYTQSIANFGLLFAGLLVVEAATRRTGAVRRAVNLGGALVVALALAFVLFYARYLPVFSNLAAGRAQPESRVLDRLDDLRRAVVVDTGRSDPEDMNDPYAGPSLDVLRGGERLASRIWRFHGPFTFALVLGTILLTTARVAPTLRGLALAWAGVALWVSLLAAGLPSPNGFQHLKDLEFVTPLLCLAMGCFADELSTRWRPAKYLLLGLWLLFAVALWRDELSQRVIPFARQ